MLKIRYENTFKRDYKKAVKRGYDFNKLSGVLEILVSGKALPDKYRDHKLSGDYSDCRECHIQPDWLLIYRINDSELTLCLIRTGTHSDLFS